MIRRLLFSAFVAVPLTPLALAAQDPPKVTLEQFRELRWIAGSWRGLDGANKPFYEEYRVVNDSTIAMRQYTDSTFKNATPDSSQITWRGGVVSNRGSSGVPSLAMELTPTSVKFARPGTTRAYTFTRNSADQWTARIHASSQGAADVIYIMRRVAR